MRDNLKLKVSIRGNPLSESERYLDACRADESAFLRVPAALPWPIARFRVRDPQIRRQGTDVDGFSFFCKPAISLPYESQWLGGPLQTTKRHRRDIYSLGTHLL
jgi:hypothetical protein